MKFIKKKEFDEIMFRPRSLIVLDLRKFDLITETALARIIDSSSRSLTSFKVSYKN